MSKKKRNKKYQGREAAQEKIVKRFEVDGSFDRKEWFAENRMKIIGWILRLILLLIAAGLGWLLFGLFR